MAQPAKTTQQLLQAAADEFNEQGFQGTDTNKIAQRAGFSPQTFYRHYPNKTAVFVAVYEAWESQERQVLESLVSKGAAPANIVDALIRQHRNYRIFRRSLRLLSVENDAVRCARALSRQRQVKAILSALSLPASMKQDITIRLLQIERLADGLVEGEFRDLGVSDKRIKEEIAGLLPFNVQGQ